MPESGPHKIVKQNEAAEAKYRFENPADRRRQLHYSTDCPAGRPRRANYFRAHEDRNGDECRQFQQIDLPTRRHDPTASQELSFKRT
jgi:hypothetical protein